MFRRKQKSNYVKIYESIDSDDKLGLIAVNGDLRDQTVTKFKEQYAIQGDHIKNGGKSSAAPILTCFQEPVLTV